MLVAGSGGIERKIDELLCLTELGGGEKWEGIIDRWGGSGSGGIEKSVEVNLERR